MHFHVSVYVYVHISYVIMIEATNDVVKGGCVRRHRPLYNSSEFSWTDPLQSAAYTTHSSCHL